MKSPCFGVNSSFSQKFKGGILGRTPGRILCIFAAFSHCVPHMFLILRPCFIISFSPVPTIILFSWHFPSFSYICPICTTCLPHFPHVFHVSPTFSTAFRGPRGRTLRRPRRSARIAWGRSESRAGRQLGCEYMYIYIYDTTTISIYHDLSIHI